MVLPACLTGDVIMWNMKKLTGMAMALVLGLSLSAGIAAAEPSGPDPNDRPQYTDNEPGWHHYWNGHRKHRKAPRHFREHRYDDCDYCREYRSY